MACDAFVPMVTLQLKVWAAAVRTRNRIRILRGAKKLGDDNRSGSTSTVPTSFNCRLSYRSAAEPQALDRMIEPTRLAHSGFRRSSAFGDLLLCGEGFHWRRHATQLQPDEESNADM